MQTNIKIYKNGKLVRQFHNLITTIGANRLATNSIQSLNLYLSTNTNTPDINETIINAGTDIGSFPIGNAAVDFTNTPIATYTINLPAGALASGTYASLGLRDGNVKISRALIVDGSNLPAPITIDSQDSILIEYSFTLNRPKQTDTGDADSFAVNLARDGIYFSGNWQDLCGSIQNSSIDWNNVYQTNTDQIINNVSSVNITSTSAGTAEIDLTIINNTNQLQNYDAISVCICSVQYLLRPKNILQVPAGTTARIIYTQKVS